jgi:NADH-quinone oxidoreductase subunit L
MSGFFSKDAIIEATHYSTIWGHKFAYFAVLGGVFITAFYSFRMFFMVFHGEERMDEHTRKHLHESPRVVTWPLIALAIPSFIIGGFTIGPMLFGSYFDGVIIVHESHDVLAKVGEHFHGAWSFIEHGFAGPAIYLAGIGVFAAWFIYLKEPSIAENTRRRFAFIYNILDRKYGFDEFNEWAFGGGSRGLGNRLWQIGDVVIIDGLFVNGSAKLVGWFSSVVRHIQTGLLYHYAFAMIIGVLMLLTLFVII